MIRAVANFFAGIIGVFIILAVIAIAVGVKFALDANADQQFLIIGVSLVAGGIMGLISLGMACVMLDIMFNIRKITSNTSSTQFRLDKVSPRTEPEL